MSSRVPIIEDGRWVVELPRKSTNAAILFREKLADGGKNSGVAELGCENHTILSLKFWSAAKYSRFMWKTLISPFS